MDLLRRLPLALLLLGCGSRLPPPGDPTGRPVAREVQGSDQGSLLDRYLRALAEEPGAGRLVVACLPGADLAARSACVLAAFGEAVDRAGACEAGTPYLTARMVARHFVCVPHPLDQERTALEAVLTFLEHGADAVSKRCAEERSWIVFAGDLPGVLGLAARQGVAPERVRALAARWRVQPAARTEADVARACAMSGA